MAMGDVGCQYTFKKNYIKPDSMLCWSQGGSLGDFSNDAMCAPEIAGSAGSAGSIQGGGINGNGWCGEMLLDMGCVTTWWKNYIKLDTIQSQYYLKQTTPACPVL